MQLSKISKIQKIIGPGLLFASNAIGTSHLILATRAGAHYGMIFFWIIGAALILKYPFFEFGIRYTNATGKHLLQGYKELGQWAVCLFLVVIVTAMFAVTGAIGAVCGGLLNTIFGFSSSSVSISVACILAFTSSLLIVGKYSLLDNVIKLISIILLITVSIVFISVILDGPAHTKSLVDFNAQIGSGLGLALTISLIGFMPTGLEISAIQSIWSVEKIRQTNYTPSLKESLFDFNLGYAFTSILAFMFLTIGAFTVFGSGQLLNGNSVEFSSKLLNIFSSKSGVWSYVILSIAAFGTIYGTLIVSMDAFSRSFVLGLQTLRNSSDNHSENQFTSYYRATILLIAGGGFLLFKQFPGSMINILEAATICIFLTSPIIAFLNFKLIKHPSIPTSHQPKTWLIVLSIIGLITGIIFTLFYLYDLVK